MMNLLALGLVLSTLTAAGVLTPPVKPPYHSHRQPASDQVLREGHRVIVLEYEREIPADFNTGTGNGEDVDTVKAVSGSTKDKICDAFGVCRDKLSDAASEVEHVVKGAKAKVSGLFHHGKDKLSEAEETVKGAKDKVLEAKDAAENKLSQAKDAMGDKLTQARGNTVDLMTDAKESAENKLFQAKEATKDKLSQTKEGVGDKVSEAKGKIGDKLSNAENKLFQAKEKAGNIAEETAQNLTDIVKRARDVAYDMASYVASPQTSRVVWAVTQLLGFATAYGTCVWVTFISSHVLASALPRQQFGMVQSKVYPVYFRAIAYGVSIAFLAQFIGRGRGSTAEKLQAYNLLAALGMVLVNMFFLEPNATKLMFERMKEVKEECRGRDMSDIVEPVMTATAATVTGLASVTTTTTATATSPAGSFGTAKPTSLTEKHNEETGAENKLRRLSIKLKRWNSYSSLVNVLTLMALTWHLVHLARLMSCCQ